MKAAYIMLAIAASALAGCLAINDVPHPMLMFLAGWFMATAWAIRRNAEAKAS